MSPLGPQTIQSGLVLKIFKVAGQWRFKTKRSFDPRNFAFEIFDDSKNIRKHFKIKLFSMNRARPRNKDKLNYTRASLL